MAMTEDGMATAAATLTIAAANLIASATELKEPNPANVVELMEELYRNMLNVVKKVDAPPPSKQQGFVEVF